MNRTATSVALAVGLTFAVAAASGAQIPELYRDVDGTHPYCDAETEYPVYMGPEGERRIAGCEDKPAPVPNDPPELHRDKPGTNPVCHDWEVPVYMDGRLAGCEDPPAEPEPAETVEEAAAGVGPAEPVAVTKPDPKPAPKAKPARRDEPTSCTD